MSQVAAFFVFILIMLALATLAIILDWMGKPIRRTFRPRTAGSPAWLPSVPANSPAGTFDQAPVPPGQPATPAMGELPGQPAMPAMSFASEPAESPMEGHRGPSPEQGRPERWQAGDSIFKPTPNGAPPSITVVRRRYWKNLSEHRASLVFGDANRALMAIGQAPQRFNPRSGAIEELSLPEPMLRQRWATKRRPSPSWGDKGVDPFALL